MRRVLVVSYDFPPSCVGIWRTLKFCRYMPDFGWKPSVLTVRPVRAPLWDEAPLAELPPGTEVRRTASLDPNRIAWLLSPRKVEAPGRARPATAERATTAPPPTGSFLKPLAAFLRSWLFIPDDRAWWAPFALREGRRWLAAERFDAIYSTSFPHTSHVVAARLAAEFRLPLLADFRDIWVGNYQFYAPPTGWHERRHVDLEAAVVATAARVVSATEPITRDFRERHVLQPANKFVTITNGFDPADYAHITPRPAPGKFTIAYVGLMYGRTSPETFLAAVARVLAHHPRFRTRLRLRFVGSMADASHAMVSTYGVSDITSVEPYVPHDDALQAMCDADALLLLIADAPGASIMLTQKVFEYLAARRPILALVPKGAARDLLASVGEGIVVDPADTAAAEAAIIRLLEQWEAADRLRVELPPNDALRDYERRHLANRLCVQLDAIADEREQRNSGLA